jgi:hypothetical protein
MKTASNCDSLRDLREYISEEKPYVDYCLIEIDDENYEPKHSWDKIEVPISQGMRTYLVEWCYDLMGDEGDMGLYEVDKALLHDLQYIAERSKIPFDWKELRNQLKPYPSNHIHLILN